MFSCYALSMPARPRWHADLRKIHHTVSALSAPFLDRPTVERLFGVKARQANNLMRGLGGYRIGPATVISREDLLLQLDKLAGPRGYAAEATRKSRVVEELDVLRTASRPRRVAPAPRPSHRSSLPAGVSILVPGQMTILFSSPEDLLTHILGLAQSASTNFAAFAAALDYGQELDQQSAPSEAINGRNRESVRNS